MFLFVEAENEVLRRLEDPDLYRDPETLKALTRELPELETALERLNEEWERHLE